MDAEHEILIGQMAGARDDVLRRIRSAVSAVSALLWTYRSGDFDIDAYPMVKGEVMKILALMSDGLVEDAEARARAVLERLELMEYEEEALEYGRSRKDGETLLFRYDMHASHLLDEICGWIKAGAIAGYTLAVLQQNIMAYIGNPAASPAWREAGLRIPSWGRGYMVNLLNAITVVTQDAINRAVQYARLQKFKEMGAIGYRTVRNSNYDCPFCDEMAKKIWPLDEIVLPYHPRCVCSAVPVFLTNTEGE